MPPSEPTEIRRDRILTFKAGTMWRAQATGGLPHRGYIVFDVTGETEAEALATLAQTALEAMEDDAAAH